VEPVWDPWRLRCPSVRNGLRSNGTRIRVEGPSPDSNETPPALTLGRSRALVRAPPRASFPRATTRYCACSRTKQDAGRARRSELKELGDQMEARKEELQEESAA